MDIKVVQDNFSIQSMYLCYQKIRNIQGSCCRLTWIFNRYNALQKKDQHEKYTLVKSVEIQEGSASHNYLGCYHIGFQCFPITFIDFKLGIAMQ